MPKKMFFVLAILLSFGLGGGAAWIYFDRTHPVPEPVRANDAFYSDLFNDEFFARSQSPYREMNRLQQRIDELLGETRNYPPFNQWFDANYGRFPAAQIQFDETPEYYIYQLDLDNYELSNLKVTTEDNIMTIKGELTRTSGTYSSRLALNQKFPLPADANSDAIDIWPMGNTIEIRLQKLDEPAG